LYKNALYVCRLSWHFFWVEVGEKLDEKKGCCPANATEKKVNSIKALPATPTRPHTTHPRPETHTCVCKGQQTGSVKKAARSTLRMSDAIRWWNGYKGAWAWAWAWHSFEACFVCWCLQNVCEIKNHIKCWIKTGKKWRI